MNEPDRAPAGAAGTPVLLLQVRRPLAPADRRPGLRPPVGRARRGLTRHRRRGVGTVPGRGLSPQPVATGVRSLEQSPAGTVPFTHESTRSRARRGRGHTRAAAAVLLGLRPDRGRHALETLAPAELPSWVGPHSG